MKILVINGPNMNLLGIREPGIYGNKTYNNLISQIDEYCASNGVIVKVFQTNHEGDIVDEIQAAYGKFDGIVINPATYTHTSVAIPDALKAVSIPAVEVHISDVDGREEFRKINYIRSCCVKTISGKGFDGYTEAIKFLVENYGTKK